MDFEEVFQVLDTDIFNKTQRRLKDVERFVLWGAWRGQTYDEMAKASDYRYTPSYLKQDVGPKLWKLLSEALGEEVSKTNFRAALERRVRLSETFHTPKLLSNLEVAENNFIKEQNGKIWHSFLHTPPFEDILVQLLQCLCNEQKTELSKDTDKEVLQLLNQLRFMLQKSQQ